MSLEMAHKVILPPKKNYIPQFLKQRDINSYSHFLSLSWVAVDRQGPITNSSSENETALSFLQKNM
jgi:hypothetical protein